MMQDAFFCTVGELAAMGRENIPPQFISGAHLIYSSPATLAFNSPGAEGFGVKRAGLAIPLAPVQHLTRCNHVTKYRLRQARLPAHPVQIGRASCRERV